MGFIWDLRRIDTGVNRAKEALSYPSGSRAKTAGRRQSGESGLAGRPTYKEKLLPLSIFCFLFSFVVLGCSVMAIPPSQSREGNSNG